MRLCTHRSRSVGGGPKNRDRDTTEKNRASRRDKCNSSLDSLVCHNHPFGELHTSRRSVVLGVLSETMQRLVWGFLFLPSAPVLRSAHIFTRSGVARMNIFPSVDLPQPRDPQSRNVKLAQLLGSLIDQPQTAQAALREARTLLLQPFVQNPEPGATVYGCANSLDEKLAAYREAMADRIARARKGGGEPQAVALERMRDYVLAELGAAIPSTEDAGLGELGEMMRLRGGGAGRGSVIPLTSSRRSLESWLSRVEQGASALRKAIKPERGDATVVDAAVAGAMVGFGTGKCLIGDPKLLALSGACSFAYAHRWPEKTDGRFRAVARRCSELAHEARAYMSGSC